MRALAADAATAKAQRLSQRTPERRLATLACYADRLVGESHDDVIDLLLIVVHDLASRSERAVERDRIRTLDQLDAAAIILRQGALVVLDPNTADADVRSAVFGLTAREDLQLADGVVGQLLGSGPDQARQRLVARYPHVRRFLPALLDRVRFAAVTVNHPVIAALEHLSSPEDGTGKLGDAPQSVVTDARRALVVVEGRVDRRRYALRPRPASPRPSKKGRLRCRRRPVGGPSPAPGRGRHLEERRAPGHAHPWAARPGSVLPGAPGG